MSGRRVNGPAETVTHGPDLDVSTGPSVNQSTHTPHKETTSVGTTTDETPRKTTYGAVGSSSITLSRSVGSETVSSTDRTVLLQLSLSVSRSILILNVLSFSEGNNQIK